MSECSGSIDSVKRVKLILNDEEELEDVGLTSSTADKHTSTGTEVSVNQNELSHFRNLRFCTQIWSFQAMRWIYSYRKA